MRSRTEASGDDDEANKNLGELNSIAARRLQNTLAALRSRERKIQAQIDLGVSSEKEKQQVERWRSRTMILEEQLSSRPSISPNPMAP